MRIPVNFVNINLNNKQNLGNELAVCQQRNTKDTNIYLHLDKSTNYDYFDNLIIPNKYPNTCFRKTYTFLKDNKYRQYKQCLINNKQHRELIAPINGIYKIIKNNKNTIIKILVRDTSFLNPLNGTIIEKFKKSGNKIVTFKDSNYFSNKDRPRFLYDHERDNQLCINREHPEFYQKRYEPDLKYTIIYDENDLLNFNIKSQQNEIFKFKNNSYVYLSINRELDTKLNQSEYFIMCGENIGEII